MTEPGLIDARAPARRAMLLAMCALAEALSNGERIADDKLGLQALANGAAWTREILRETAGA